MHFSGLTNTLIPSSVLKFYVHLYTEKNDETNTVSKTMISQATLSWTRLSTKEKDVVRKKYDEYINAYKRKHAEYLKNMEPYLKKRKVKESPKLDENCENGNITAVPDAAINHNNLPNASDTEQENQLYSITTQSFSSNEMQHSNLALQNNILYDSFKFGSNNLLSEPSPPPFKNTKEFYMMMQSLYKDVSNIPWLTLSTAQKRRYQTALRTLKEEYIQNYLLYLRSLPSEQLFELLNDSVTL